MIKVGIGGWTFEPWRGVFYPPKLPHARELSFASRAVTSIEINGTFYGSQKPASFQRWADETPDDFVFSLKGPRFATNRRVLAEAGPSVERFLESGLSELGSKLGPILWQMPPTKTFEEEDFAAFLALLPKTLDGRALRHVVEVRHESFRNALFIALLKRHSVPVVFADSEKYLALADLTGDFVYARLQRAQEAIPTGYAPEAIAAFAEHARAWERGTDPEDLPHAGKPAAKASPRDVFIYLINGAKVRAPAAACALIDKLNK
ncbi:MAG: DUF72 domain-containing protein [Pseudorhodoplanes sp.]